MGNSLRRNVHVIAHVIVLSATFLIYFFLVVVQPLPSRLAMGSHEAGNILPEGSWWADSVRYRARGGGGGGGGSVEGGEHGDATRLMGSPLSEPPSFEIPERPRIACRPPQRPRSGDV